MAGNLYLKPKKRAGCCSGFRLFCTLTRDDIRFDLSHIKAALLAIHILKLLSDLDPSLYYKVAEYIYPRISKMQG